MVPKSLSLGVRYKSEAWPIPNKGIQWSLYKVSWTLLNNVD